MITCLPEGCRMASNSSSQPRKSTRRQQAKMDPEEFKASVAVKAPPAGLSIPLAALWWEAKGDWSRAHDLVNELETRDGMAVHAYLHRKEGDASNAHYWYQRAGRDFYR